MVLNAQKNQKIKFLGTYKNIYEFKAAKDIFKYKPSERYDFGRGFGFGCGIRYIVSEKINIDGDFSFSFFKKFDFDSIYQGNPLTITAKPRILSVRMIPCLMLFYNDNIGFGMGIIGELNYNFLFYRYFTDNNLVLNTSNGAFGYGVGIRNIIYGGIIFNIKYAKIQKSKFLVTEFLFAFR